jgi:hypothetical protein
MYQKPALQRFGSFKDLTQTGFGGAGDGCIVLDPTNGDVVDGNPNDGSVAPFCQERDS